MLYIGVGVEKKNEKEGKNKYNHLDIILHNTICDPL